MGSSNHIDMEIFGGASGLELVHVPYNGPAAALAGVASGDAQLMIVSVTGGAGVAQTGRVRPIAVFAHARSRLFPDVATAAEQRAGAIDLTAWVGLVAPAGTPAPIVARLNDALRRALRAPAALTWAVGEGLEPILESSEMFAATIAQDRRRWGDTVKRMGIATP